jgi:outer membrane lipoprotein SlyB
MKQQEISNRLQNKLMTLPIKASLWQIVIIQLFIALLLICFIKPVYSQTIKASVSENTPVSIVAEWPVSSDTQPGEHFSARIVEDIVTDDGQVLIPKNSRVVGTVVDITNARSFHRDAKVDIQFEKIIFPDNVQTITISADGLLIKDDNEKLKLAAQAGSSALAGAALGSVMGFKFGGIIGTGTSSASNLAIGAVSGAGVSLITFLSKKGEEVDITPGLPMVLNILAMDEQKYKQEQLAMTAPGVNAVILKYDQNKLSVEIENSLRHSIPLTNLKIVDGLGYTVSPNMAFAYHDTKAIPAKSLSTYEFQFNPTTSTKGKYWLVLTDSFNKQEYFRKEIL